MNAEYFDERFDLSAIAYIKPTKSEEAHRLGLVPPGLVLPPDALLYVVHLGDGSVVGFTGDRDSAYGALVQHELIPVTLH
jgi:hypothetical protein